MRGVKTLKKQGFIAGSVILAASVAAVKILGALFKIPLANLLGGTGMGYFSCAYGVFMPVYALAITGIPAAVSKYVAENEAFECYANIRRIKKTALYIFSAVGAAGALITALLSVPLCRYAMGSEDAWMSVAAIAPAVFFGCITAVYRGYFEGLRNMVPTALSQLAEAAVKLVCGLLFCVLALDWAKSNPDEFAAYFCDGDISRIESMIPAVASAASVLGITLSSAAGTVFLILRYHLMGDGLDKSTVRKDKHLQSTAVIVKALGITVLPVAAGSLITNLTSVIDLTTIIRCLEAAAERSPSCFADICAECGIKEMPNFIYGSFTGLAVTVFNLVPAFTNMIGKSALPAAAAAFASGSKREAECNAGGVLMVTSIAAMPCGVGIAVMHKEILNVLFSSRTAEIEACGGSLSVLGIAVIFLSLSAASFSLLQGMGRASLPVKLMLAGVILKLAGNLLLIPIPSLNVTGAAISTLLCYALITVLSLTALVRQVGTGVLKVMIRPFYASVLCAAAAYVARELCGRVGYGMLFTLACAMAAGGGVYVLSLWLMCGRNEKMKGYLFPSREAVQTS